MSKYREEVREAAAKLEEALNKLTNAELIEAPEVCVMVDSPRLIETQYLKDDFPTYTVKQGYSVVVRFQPRPIEVYP